MRWLLVLIVFLAPYRAVAQHYDIIAYHDVRDDTVSNYDPDQFAISTSNLIAHFRWFRDAGFTPVSVEQILQAEAGRASLPENAVLLTFDDGLASFYTRVYPLLRQFGYPAVVSVVSSWIDTSRSVEYSGESLDANEFVTWDQIREMQDSGLVEVGSHSHDLHRGIPGNPQGNEQPAAVTRIFDGNSYEGLADYRQRITNDLQLSIATIIRETGRRPRVITWPFGAYNDEAAEIAYGLGMRLSLTLEPDDSEHEGLLHRGRLLIYANPTLADLSAELVLPDRPELLRVAQVDLDYVYDPDPVQQEENLGRLLDRIKGLEISHVYLQAYADPDGDDAADAVYFPNRHLPVRADLFSRVAWQLKTRADVRVYAWLPMLGFSGGPFREDMRVVDKSGDAAEGDRRLSPFHPEAAGLIGDIYEDLAIYARFDGLLFHDDGRLNEREDFSEAAMAVYRDELGADITPEQLLSDPALNRRFTEIKVRALFDLGESLGHRVRKHLPALRTARNLFASALLDSGAPTYLAQDYRQSLEKYDYVVLLAMPALERADDSVAFFENLVAASVRHDPHLAKTVFELQTVDWSSGHRIQGSELSRTMRWLQSRGVRHLGYYPEDFVANHPSFSELREGFSLAVEYGEDSR